MLWQTQREKGTITVGFLRPHLTWRSWQDDAEVGSQLLDGFGKFRLAVLDDVTLIEDTVIEFDISKKRVHVNNWALVQNTKTFENKNNKYSLKKVDVIPYNIIRGYYKIVFFHLVLQPGKWMFE